MATFWKCKSLLQIGYITFFPEFKIAVEGNTETWGHELIDRQNKDGSTQSRTWVDNKVKLPPSKLVKFKAFVREYMGSPVKVRFQIWSGNTVAFYKLLYEKVAVIPNRTGIVEVCT